MRTFHLFGFGISVACMAVGCMPIGKHIKESIPAPVLVGSTDLLQLPHVTVDRKNQLVDIEAMVVMQSTLDGQWLELLACTENGRTHESILAVKARPSHIHYALLLVGSDPGTPMVWGIHHDHVKIEKHPSGTSIAISAIYQDENGKVVHVPVNQWVVNRYTNKPLVDNIWLFTGSRFIESSGRRIYQADRDGTIVSLVHFGDDLLARPTELTNRNDGEAWGAVDGVIPPVGTLVTLRLRPTDLP